jgi:nitrite reductase (NADH) small subunit
MTRWHRVCALDDILPDTGVSALVAGRQVAVFRVADRVFALDNRDPFCGACVLARGIVGDANGVLKVASPMYKQSFALETGACLDDDTVAIAAFPARVQSGVVEVALVGS